MIFLLKAALVVAIFVWNRNCFVLSENFTQDYQLIGFERNESIPVVFPKDICVIHVDGVKFAASLHYRKDSQLEFVLFRNKNGNYEKVFDRSTPKAIDMDCVSMGSKAYVALAYNLTENVTAITDGSPIFEVTVDEISTFQFFPTPFQNSVYLRKHKTKLYLITSYQESKTSKQCHIYQWSNYHFNHIGQIRCDHAKAIEIFNINNEEFLMIANYGKAQKSTTNNRHPVSSILYKFKNGKQKFFEHQKFKTHGAVDAKYFYIDERNKGREHFLVIGNSLSDEDSEEESLKEGGAASIFYKYQNGLFIPMQKFHFIGILEFLPVQAGNGKFVLLVACKNQDMKFLHYDGRQFYSSNVQLTEEAFGKGVAKLRSFKDENNTYIVIANEKMLENATNIYLPLYQPVRNQTDRKRELLQRFTILYEKLTKENLTNAYRNIEQAAKNLSRGNGYFNIAHIRQAKALWATLPKRNITKQYLQKIAVINEAISRLEKRIDFLIGPMNGTTKTDDPVTYDTLHLKNFTVTDRLTVNTVNNISLSNIEIKKITADPAVSKAKYITNEETMSARQSEPDASQPDARKEFKEIHAKQLILRGTMNGINFNDFESRLLKNRGEQTIKASFNFSKLDVDQLHVNGKLNNETPAKLIRITDGSFVINQDITFVKSPIVNRLEINDRLNHINIVHRELDVLHKNSEELQVIDGHKIFENVQLLEPFLIRGKIRSPHLDRINPVSVIDHDITLQGDYELSGKVFIGNELAAMDFYGESKRRSLNQVFENGLPITIETIETAMRFEQPIEAKNIETNMLNELDTRDLLKSNSKEQQIVTGHKKFLGNLYISRGSSEVTTINRINISDLMETRLHKFGDQTITGNLQFRNLFIKNISAANTILLNGTNLNDIITTTTEQSLVNDITIGSLTLQSAKISNITGWKKIFNNDINYLMKDTVRLGQSATIFGYKRFTSNITTKELIVKNKINDQPVQDFESSLSSILDDLVVKSDVKIDGDLKVEQLQFTGKLNGISAEDFGSIWLLSETDQLFTASQNFEKVKVEKLYLTGLMNGQNLMDLVNNVYWIDQTELLPRLVLFKNLTTESDLIVHGSINQLNFAEDILVKKSEIPQHIMAKVTCNGDLITTGHLQNLTFLNNINIPHLQAALRGEIPARLSVDSAVFEQYPSFRLLNEMDLASFANEIWFADEDTLIGSEFKFDAAEFRSFLHLNGPLNDVNLEILRDNYFSLSKAQQVSTSLVFEKAVKFASSLSGPELSLNGNIFDTKSKRSLNLTDFAQKTLRKDIDQEITGEWRIFSATVNGDLNDVLINGRRLIDDVLRHDINGVQNITAAKHFPNIKIANLFCSSESRINEIDMNEWIQNSAFIYGNYTIHGTVTADDLAIHDDVKVLGSVNGIVFDEAFVMLKDIDQVVNGDVIFETKATDEDLPVSIKNLDVNTINKIDMESMFDSLIPFKDQLSIDGNFAFKTMPIVQRFHSERGLFKLDNTTDSPAFYVDQLRKDYVNLEKSFKVNEIYLSHFDHSQNITDSIQQIVQLKIPTGTGEIVNILAMLRGAKKQNLYISFHRWDARRKSFDVHNELFSWHPKDGPILSCDKILMQDAEILVVETRKFNLYYEHFITSTNEGLQMLLEVTRNESVKIVPIEFKQRQCILSIAVHQNSLLLQCLKFIPNDNIQLTKEIPIYTKHPIIRVLPLQGSHFIILTPNSMEFWNLDQQMGPVGEIALEVPRMIAHGKFNNDEYLAVATEMESIEIFRSTNNSVFVHIQKLQVKSVLDMKFATILDSQDFFLYVLTIDPIEPFTGYVYRGIVGFEPHFKPINLKSGKRFEIISLEEEKKYFISHIANRETVFLEAILKKA